jgi:hypothetical protein
VLARQLLPATPERGTTYHMQPLGRTPSSFSSRDPVYARFRAGLLGRHQATEVNVAQVRGAGTGTVCCVTEWLFKVKTLWTAVKPKQAKQRNKPKQANSPAVTCCAASCCVVLCSLLFQQVVVKALSDCGVRDAILYPGAKCIELLKVGGQGVKTYQGSVWREWKVFRGPNVWMKP